MSYLDTLRWNADGLVPAIAQDAAGGRVLMLAWMNREALSASVATGYAHYWSRSRQRLWKKGESSGHVQSVREVRIDCDADSVLLIVDQAGGVACHTGHERCFYLRLEADAWRDVEPVSAPGQPGEGRVGAAPEVAPPPARVSGEDVAGTLARVAATIEARRSADPASSYVASLFAGNGDAVLKKIGEEATETVLAAKAGDPGAVTHEVADLWFHCLVLLARHGLSPQDVLGELARRHGTSGIAEKAARKRDP